MSLVSNILEKKGKHVITVPRSATVLDAARKMHQHHVGAVLVMDESRIVGIFTERDLLNRVVAVEKDPAATPVSEVMTDRVAVCTAATTLEECRAAMTRNKMRHLPVMDGDRLVGIITSGDILARELQDQEETIRYLHEYMLGPA